MDEDTKKRLELAVTNWDLVNRGEEPISEPDWNKLSKIEPPNNTKENQAWKGAWLEGEMVGYAKCKLEYPKTKKAMSEKIQVDGYRVIEEYLLTKGEDIVSKDMKILFKPLIDFGLIVYGMKCNSTNRLAMKFNLERFFMRNCLGELSGHETKWVKVPETIYNRVKNINDKYRQS